MVGLTCSYLHWIGRVYIVRKNIPRVVWSCEYRPVRINWQDLMVFYRDYGTLKPKDLGLRPHRWYVDSSCHPFLGARLQSRCRDGTIMQRSASQGIMTPRARGVTSLGKLSQSGGPNGTSSPTRSSRNPQLQTTYSQSRVEHALRGQRMISRSSRAEGVEDIGESSSWMLESGVGGGHLIYE